MSVKSNVKFPVGFMDSLSGTTVSGTGLKVNVIVISDSYPGMEWTLNGVDVDVESGSGKGKMVVSEEGQPPVKE